MLYVPGSFRESDVAVMQEFMRRYPFATIVSCGDGIHVSHLPVLLDPQRGPYGTIVGHLARANGHWRDFNGQAGTTCVFHGPHAYISPTWYTERPAVPTWNYAVVHAIGTPAVIDDQQRLAAIIDETLSTFELNGNATQTRGMSAASQRAAADGPLREWVYRHRAFDMLRMTLSVVVGLAVLAIPSARVVAQDEPARAGIAGSGLLAIFESQDQTYLGRVRRPSLEMEEPSPRVHEYRSTAAVSPDGRRVAIGSGGPRGGITIFDVTSLEQTHRVPAGIAPDALAWLSPTRVAAALTCNLANASGRGCEIVLVDADAGEIVDRWFVSLTPPLPPIPKPVAVTKHGVLFLLAHVNQRAPARLVLITPDELRRDLSLPEIELGVVPGGSLFDQTSGGLAVDSAGDTAFVVGAGPTLAEIRLETMTVQYHDIQELEPGSPGSWRTIILLDSGRLAVTGEGPGPPPRVPAGVTIVDTATWSGWRVDADASRAVFAGQTLLTYGGRSRGITGHTSSGQRRFQLFQAAPERQSILSVRADGPHAFVTRSSADGRGVITEIDAVNGTVVRESMTPAPIVDLLPLSN